MTKKIQIKGDVVDNMTGSFYEYFGMPSAYPASIEQILNSGSPNEDIEVDIASNGGDVFAASEIYTLIKGYQGNVVVNIQGLAASAASVIAMAGDKVNISPTAQLMIHKAWEGVQGNADDLAHEAGVMDGIDQSIASAYEAKTGMKQADILQLMSQETWLTAQDAVDKHFADAIMYVDEKQPQIVNTVSRIPDKKAINKFLNLIAKAAPKPPKPVTENKIQNDKAQLKEKLSFLFAEN
jgi:ATP-dependent protease ClpP protease subunit